MVEDYYDEECMGVIEVVSGKRHVFPNMLVQQSDVKTEKGESPARIAEFMTAEFNYAEFRFSEQQVAVFIDTMAKALTDFQAAHARQKLRDAIETGSLTTIYVCPDYARDIAGPQKA